VTHAGGGFTLVELLVVMAVMTALAGLMLPALSAARMAAYRIQCASNLHQIGVGLTLYVDDFHKYPAFGDSHRPSDATDPRSVFWDATILAHAGGSQKLFLCPGLNGTNNLEDKSADNRRPGSVTDGWSVRDKYNLLWPNPSYGYNGAGVGLVPPTSGGLGVGLDPWLQFHPKFRQTVFRAGSSIVVPSDMIALVDYDALLDDDGDGDLHPDAIYSLTLTGARHRGRANAAFCDAHVEYARTNRLTADNARQRWNYDHEPHLDAALYFP
jgi:prepilin-type processing-associated H-X9-DG protein/prepilin-type N-terminal cleavage/methylation domain-containing protein